MTSAPLPDRQRDLLARSRARLGETAEKVIPASPGEPGYLYLLPETAEWPLEWLVLEPIPGAGGRVLAVPADTHPEAGDGDVSLGAGERLGPLQLRIGWATELSSELFSPRAATGRLDGATLLRARQALGTDASRQPATPALAAWQCEVLAPAVAAVTAAHPAPPAPDPRSRAANPARPWMALAAGLAACAVGLFIWGWRSREPARGTEAQRGTPSVNPAFVYLAPEGSLRSPLPQTLSPGDQPLILILHLPALDHAPAYNLELVRVGSARALWRGEDVRVLPSSEIRLLLPGELLPAGTYRLTARPVSGPHPELHFSLEISDAPVPH